MWKPVFGYENNYEVSESGEVRSIPRVQSVSDMLGRSYTVNRKGKDLTKREHEFGYYLVTLSQDNIPKTVTVHKIVAEAFLGPRAAGEFVRHLDGNPKNNHYSNLAYGTQKQNMQDALRHGTVEKGEDRYNARLLGVDVVAIRIRKAAGEVNHVLAKEYGVSEPYLHKLVTGQKWASAGGPLSASRKINRLSPSEGLEVLSLFASGKTKTEIAAIKKASLTQITRILGA